MNPSNRIALLLGKIIAFLIRLSGLGEGATWPGELLLRIRPEILKELNRNKKQVILVAGTNGKTTTVKMLEGIIRATGRKVRRNDSGANLDNGITSTLIRDADFSGKLESDVFILEVDEAAMPAVVSEIKPTLIILLNLFRDQLDRYGEVDLIAGRWRQTLAALSPETKVIINADDPHLSYISIGCPGKVFYFGLENPALYRKPEHAADSVYCPSCGNRLTFAGMYFSHLGKYACGRCRFRHPDVNLTSGEIRSPLEGTYNLYNTMAAVLAARLLNIPGADIFRSLEAFVPAFGRMEKLVFRSTNIRIILSKNPTGLNESVKTVLKSGIRGPLLIVLNDRIPDGRDVSWIWDADMEMLSEYGYPVLVSGDRCFDMGVRLKYAGIGKSGIRVIGNLSSAVSEAMALTKSGETLTVLPTYSAMLEVRKIITGRKIL